MVKFARPALAAALLIGLVGCSSTDDISDMVLAVNPFAGSPKHMPGDRKPVMADQSPAQMAKGRAVTIGGQKPNGNWSQSGGPAGNNSGNLALDGGSGTRIWSIAAADAGSGSFTQGRLRVFSRPVVADGRVYVYDPNGNVSAHAIGGGGRAWRVNVRPEDVSTSATGGGVAADSGRVFVATGFGNVAALDAASGAKLWEKKIGEPARGAPSIADGKVYIVSQANVLYALNASDGAEAWTFRGVPEIGGLLSSGNPAISAGVIVVPFSSGELVALDAAKGTPVWNDALARSSRNSAVTGLSDIAASPVIEDGVVYATGVGSRTAAFQVKTGQRLWDQSIGSAHTPIVSGNAVFIVDLDDNLVALDRKSGEVLWSNKLPVTRTRKVRTNWAGPVLAGGSLWLVSNEGGLIALDPTSGRVVGTHDTGEPAMVAPIVAQGKLIVLSGSGNLAAYN